ncbi:lysozyme [Brevundimonas faecalis]|uniref:lysozyme n=1 Tax=Brevundimonas faecalis TaxID=947378 RepID=UPI00339579D3
MASASSQRMKVSREGLLLIKSFEGFRPRTVRRRDGAPVIGYGHTRSARPGASVSEQEAELLLQYDLLPIVEIIHARVAVPLNQHQFDALASFIFSIGVERFETSDVLDRLKAGSTAQAADAMSGWPDRTPPPVDAPYRRRSAERALFDVPAEQAAPLDRLLTAPVYGAGGPPRTEDRDAPPATVQILRHEKTDAPSPALGDTGAVVFIGGVGLLAFAAGIAAFRRLLGTQPISTGTMVVGVALALIGLIFIGTAGWNLMRARNKKGDVQAR